MDKLEAIKMLDRKMAELQRLPYSNFEWWQQRRHVEFIEVQSATGQIYKIEVQAVLEDSSKIHGNIRVLATIDDSHLRSLTKSFPMIKQFVIAPDNSIVS